MVVKLTKVQKQIRKLLNNPCLRRGSLIHSIDKGIRRGAEKSPRMALDSQKDSLVRKEKK